MKRFEFRVPDEGDSQKISARRYVQWAWPEGELAQIDALFDSGGVEADGILITRPERPLAPDTTVFFESGEEGARTYGVPEVEALLRSEEWVVVDKPAGIPGRMAEEDPTDPIRFMADVLGLDRDVVVPVWQTPAGAAGPWLLGLGDEATDRLRSELASGRLKTSWQAIIPRPQRTQGRWQAKGVIVDFAVTRTRGELAEVQLQPTWEELGDATELLERLLACLASVGVPVLGDAAHGGYLVPGDLRIRLGALYGTEEFANSWSAPRDWWPEMPVMTPVEIAEESAKEAGPGEIAELHIPQRVLDHIEERDHPWVSRDPAIAESASLRSGTMVQLVGPDGAVDHYALFDGAGPIAARRWSEVREEAEDFSGEVQIRLDEAIGRRRALYRAMGEIDVFRVVHAEADGLPGLVVDQLGSVVRVAVVGRCARAYGDSVYERIAEIDPEATVIAVEADPESSARAGGRPQIRTVHQGASREAVEGTLILRENGLRYCVDPERPFELELSVDQRENRRRVVERAEPGQHWLVASDDGASFAVALAKKGVSTTCVHSGDDRAKRLDAHVELNGLSTEFCEHIIGDLSEVLASEERRFDGIVVDRCGLDGASAKQDTAGVLERCVDAAASGAWILCCRRPVGQAASMVELARRLRDGEERRIDVVEAAVPSEDFPVLEGFAEGRTFDGVWIKVGGCRQSR